MTKLKEEIKKKVTGLALTCVYLSGAFIDIALLGVFFTPPLSRLASTAETDK